MEPCPICGAAHAPAAAGEPCLAACVKALAARLAALEQPTVRGVPFDSQSGSLAGADAAVAPIVSLGGSAGGSGAMK